MKYKDYIVYLIMVSIILADIIIYAGLIKIFFDSDPTIIAGLIAFIGAIIGGTITYNGVRQTIAFETKKERYKQLPRLINDSWKIKKVMIHPFAFKSAIDEQSGLDDEAIVEQFYNKYEESITELAATIGPQIYNLVNKFFDLISDYVVYKRRDQLEEWYLKIQEISEKVSLKIKAYEDEYSQATF